jgi:hypothetical protein
LCHCACRQTKGQGCCKLEKMAAAKLRLKHFVNSRLR